jgi:hypothetical protein
MPDGGLTVCTLWTQGDDLEREPAPGSTQQIVALGLVADRGVVREPVL